MKANDHIFFVLLDFGNSPKSLFKRTMTTLLYEPFLAKFVEYVGSMMKHPNLWLWIVEDIRANEVEMLLEFVVSTSHYGFDLGKGANSTLKVKKTKVMDTTCVYYMYNTTFVVGKNNPINKLHKGFNVYLYIRKKIFCFYKVRRNLAKKMGIPY